MTEKMPAAPPDLSRESRAWWLDIVREFILESSHLKLLTMAARAWDRAENARMVLRKHGLTFKDDRGAIRPRPEIAVERNSAILFARLVRELRLTNTTPEDDTGRIPRNEASFRRAR